MLRRYEISRPANNCVMCGQSLNKLEWHPSALNISASSLETSNLPGRTLSNELQTTEQGILLRYDYCPECWEKVKGQPFFSRWVARRFPKTTEGSRPHKMSQKKKILQFFEQTVNNPEEQNRAARLYILAHLLLRLRVFNWRGYHLDPETGNRFLTFERARSREKVCIPHINLTEAQLAEAQEFIDELLKEE